MLGGVLLAAYDLRRPTRHIDLHAQSVANDNGTVLAIVRQIADIERDGGLVYDAAGATAETTREGDGYSGVRVSMACQLATARRRFHVDVNVGDPMFPAAELIEVPRLLGGTIMVRGYPLAMIHAEKIVTAVLAQARWAAWARKQWLTDRLPQQFGDVLRAVAAFADPPLRSETGSLRWKPSSQSWVDQR